MFSSKLNRDNLLEHPHLQLAVILVIIFQMVIFYNVSGSTIGLIIGENLAEFIGQMIIIILNRNIKNSWNKRQQRNYKHWYWKNPKSRNEGVVKIKGYYGTLIVDLLSTYTKKFYYKNIPKIFSTCRRKWAMGYD